MYMIQNLYVCVSHKILFIYGFKCTYIRVTVKHDGKGFFVTQAIIADVTECYPFHPFQVNPKDSFIDMHEEDQYFI